MSSNEPITPLSQNREENYHRFFVEAIDTGCLWSLQHNDESWAVADSEKSNDVCVIPFWSQPEFAPQHCEGDWADYQVVAISLEEFMDDWLTGMHDDVVMVGINWDSNLEGEEYEPLDVLYAFEKEYLPNELLF